MEKLPMEQRELLAKLELSDSQHRQKLLEMARGRDWRSRYFSLYNFAIVILLSASYSFNVLHLQENKFVLYLVFGIWLVMGLFFHIARTNRRMDALIELLDVDRKAQESRWIETRDKNN